MRAVMGVLALLAISPALSQPRSDSPAFPSRPVRLVTPSAPGSTADLLGRMAAQKLSEAWGQPVVVDARPGAAGIVASSIVARAAPDGYTLIMVAGNHAINPSLYSKLPYDTARDFEALTEIGAAPLLVASHPAVPVSSMKELIAYARAHPRRLNYASAGKGTPGHLTMALLSSMAKLELVHVAYSGGGPVLNAVVSGESQMLASGVLILLPLVKNGKLRALAVTTSSRSRAAPEVPTVAESGVPGFAVSGWWGMLAPRATPRPILDRIQKDIAAVLATPDVQARLANDGIEPVASTPEQFSAFVRDEMAKWSAVVRDAGIRAD
jgi:tripartite-type tricarboxylate transporter receptor subunit TctC